MVPVSTTNSLTARGFQHPHIASAGRDQRDTVDEAGAVISTPSQSGLLTAPIILVGNKSDLVNPEFLVASNIESIMNEFPNIETFVACPAKDLSNVSEVFHYAQKAVLHPSSPLFNYDFNELTKTAVRVVHRIFRLCDLDNDGYLSDNEINYLQVKAFAFSGQNLQLRRWIMSRLHHRIRFCVFEQFVHPTRAHRDYVD